MSRRTLKEAMSSQSARAGSIRVAAGLVFYGGTTYLMLALAARTLGAVRYADFAVFWGLVYGVGLGAALPLEQEVSRRVSERREHGGTGSAVLRTAYRLGALVVLGLAALLAVILPLISQGGASHVMSMWAATVGAVAGLALAYVSRGGLSGQRRFSAYATQLGTEGGVRLLGCGVLAGLGVASLVSWMWLVPAALLAGVLVTTSRKVRTLDGEPEVPMRHLARSIAALTACTGISQSLMNFGPIAVLLLSDPSQQAAAGRFMAAALIARLPIFAFAAIQAVLLPHLVGAAVRGDRPGFVATVRKVLGPTVALGLLGIILSALAGPFVLGVLGPDYVLPRRDIVLLSLAVAIFLLTLVLQQAAIALGAHWAAATAWLAAALVFVIGLFLPLGPVQAVELALIASCVSAVLGLAVVVRGALPRLSGLGVPPLT